jgi:hypothetical protein
MTESPDMRAGDADRDATLDVLREAFAQGRLTAEEYQQRMEQATQARTMGQLVELVADLPAPRPPRAVAVPAPAALPTPAEHEPGSLQRSLAAWAGVSVLVNVIWVATWLTSGSTPTDYWPIWVMGPWGAVLLMRWLGGRGSG